MPLANPAVDLVDFLHLKVLAGVTLTKGTNLFVGQVRAEDQTPSPSAFVLNTGGPQPTPYLGGAREAYWRPTVQVLVRGAAQANEAGERLALAAFSALALASVPMTGGGSYVAVLPRDSAPNYLGQDDSRRGLWSMNFECQFKGTAA